MAQPRQVLTVFLASPNDLNEERQAVREAVASADRIVVRMGWSVELCRWEDTRPATGRPQEIINPAVDSCDIFLGLLWKRWGQPTGEYSSGFEEEFNRAKKRNEESGVPEIWIAFKKLADEDQGDPGPQLKQVLTFRKARESIRDVLFKEFGDANDLMRQLSEWLIGYIFDKAKASPVAEEIPMQEPSKIRSPAPSAESATAQSQENEAQKELQTILASMQNTIGSLRPQADDAKSKRPDEFDIVRLYLLAATFMSDSTTRERLGAHEINAVYKQRERLHLTPAERRLIWRSLIGNPYANFPGWFWFSDLAPASLASSLFVASLKDNDADVREHALGLLRKAAIPPNAGMASGADLARAIMADAEASVRRAGADYLAAVAPHEDLADIKQAIEQSGTGSLEKLDEAMNKMAVRSDPNALFSAALAGSENVSEKIKAIEAEHAVVQSELLAKGLAHNDVTIREFAARRLLEQGSLTEAQARLLLVDASYRCRHIGYDTLVTMGQRFPVKLIRSSLAPPAERGSRARRMAFLMKGVDPDDIILKQYMSYSHGELLREIDWGSPDGALAYRALALRFFPEEAERIRTDLAEDFEGMKQEWLGKIESPDDNQFAEQLAALLGKKGLTVFVRRMFIAAAMAGLAKNGDKQDVVLARRHITAPLPEYPGEPELLAAQIIGQFGEESDVVSLLTIAKSQRGQLKRAAAHAALRLSPGLQVAARDLLDSNDSELFADALKSLAESDPQQVRETLEPHLESQDFKIRELSLAYFARTCREDQLSEVLANYPKGSMTYYNVVCWLDRLLYSPQPLREMYQQSIIGKIATDDRGD